MSENPQITIGPIRFNPRRLEVIVDGKTVRLTPAESRILHFLAVRANTVCTTSQISLGVYGRDAGETGFMIKAAISHLRYKLEPDSTSPVYLFIVPGEGYKLVIPD